MRAVTRQSVAVIGFAVLGLVAGFNKEAAAAAPKVPVLYSTDLYHPHGDPDDHYDLAALFAIQRFDIRGIVIDVRRGDDVANVGREPLEQMMHITDRRAPYAVGITRDLRYRTDKALDVPEQFQGGVELMLSVLREAEEPVVVFIVGSGRDLAAAFNREPELLRQKVKAVYLNAGNYPGRVQWEHNVQQAPVSYFRLFETGLPIYWCPCWGAATAGKRIEASHRVPTWGTYFQADQTEVVGACVPAVRNFFVYCLTRSPAEPIAFLESGPHPLPGGMRNMWCTPSFLHAAGLQIFRIRDDEFRALSPEEAAATGLADRKVDAFEFVPMRAEVAGPPSAAEVKPAEAARGELAAAYRGCAEDRVGTRSPEPDGRHDCCVRLTGLPAEGKIENIVLTGPRNGRWELVETGRWWRVAFDRHGEQLDCYFQFYAEGRHNIEFAFEDGTRKSASFDVPPVGRFGLKVELQPDEANGFVFQTNHPKYEQIMASVLKNLLARLGRDRRAP